MACGATAVRTHAGAPAAESAETGVFVMCIKFSPFTQRRRYARWQTLKHRGRHRQNQHRRQQACERESNRGSAQAVRIDRNAGQRTFGTSPLTPRIGAIGFQAGLLTRRLSPPAPSPTSGSYSGIDTGFVRLTAAGGCAGIPQVCGHRLPVSPGVAARHLKPAAILRQGRCVENAAQSSVARRRPRNAATSAALITVFPKRR